MRWKLFSLGRTAVYLHLATVLFGVYMVCMGQGKLLLISFVSIFLHELAHGAVSALMGYVPDEIELTPMGALMRLEDEADLPAFKRLLMLSAGPAATLLLCWGALMLRKLDVLSLSTGRMMFTSNLLLFLLNMLPALPMDGGRILALILSLRLKEGAVKQILRCAGTVIGLAAIGGNFALSLLHGGWNLSLAMTGCFLMYAAATATTSQALAELRRLMDRKIRLEQRGWLGCGWVVVTAALPLRKAIQNLSPCRYTVFRVVHYAALPCEAIVDEAELIAAYLENPSENCGMFLPGKPCHD